MTMDTKSALDALKDSGLQGLSLLSALLPFGRDARLRTLLRQRQAVLEAKNTVLDALGALQKPLQVFGLHDRQSLAVALEDPEKKRAILGRSLSRETLEDEARKWGAELGPAFDQALRELLGEGRILNHVGPAGDDVYLLVHRLSRTRYDLSAINHLLHEGKDYASRLKKREGHEQETKIGRTYRL